MVSRSFLKNTSASQVVRFHPCSRRIASMRWQRESVGELVLELQSVSVEVEVVGAQPREMEDPSTLLESQGLGPCAFGPCQPCRQRELRGLLR